MVGTPYFAKDARTWNQLEIHEKMKFLDDAGFYKAVFNGTASQITAARKRAQTAFAKSQRPITGE